MRLVNRTRAGMALLSLQQWPVPARGGEAASMRLPRRQQAAEPRTAACHSGAVVRTDESSFILSDNDSRGCPALLSLHV